MKKKEFFTFSIEKLLYSLVFPALFFILDIIFRFDLNQYFRRNFEENIIKPVLFWPAGYFYQISIFALLGIALNIIYLYTIGCFLVYLKNKTKKAH